jgi:hypothetical protein
MANDFRKEEYHEEIIDILDGPRLNHNFIHFPTNL